jgi:hypothetical protein
VFDVGKTSVTEPIDWQKQKVHSIGRFTIRQSSTAMSPRRRREKGIEDLLARLVALASQNNGLAVGSDPAELGGECEQNNSAGWHCDGTS